LNSDKMKACAEVLQVYWDLGESLHSMDDIDQNMTCLELEISVDDAEGALIFRDAYSRLQLKTAQKRGFTWADIKLLIRVKNKRNRAALERIRASEVLSTKEFVRQVNRLIEE